MTACGQVMASVGPMHLYKEISRAAGAATERLYGDLIYADSLIIMIKKASRFYAVILGMALIVPLPSHSQQFGLNMGESTSQVKARGVILKPVSRYVFSATSLPSGNTLFDDYRLMIAPKSGLCKIDAWISEITDSPYGDSTRAKYDSLYRALSAKYGNSKSFDFLRTGSIWSNSREWMMSLYQKERRLAAFWDAEEGSRLPANLKAISIQAYASSSSTSMISVSYEFNNVKSCFSEKDAVEQQNL